MSYDGWTEMTHRAAYALDTTFGGILAVTHPCPSCGQPLDGDAGTYCRCSNPSCPVIAHYVRKSFA
jgi:hypothetical protein